jgi:hypothetical protein
MGYDYAKAFPLPETAESTGNQFISRCCTASTKEFVVDGERWLVGTVAGHGWNQKPFKGWAADVNGSGSFCRKGEGSRARAETPFSWMHFETAEAYEAFAAAVDGMWEVQRDNALSDPEDEDACARRDALAELSDAIGLPHPVFPAVVILAHVLVGEARTVRENMDGNDDPLVERIAIVRGWEG